MKTGPIVILEDDVDDHELFKDVLKELKITNEVLWFTSSSEVIEFLKNTEDQPFIIFSDINLPGLSGIELKRVIDADENMRKKSIPFIFYSTAANQEEVNKAYTQMTVQGFFQKPSRYADIKTNIKIIFEYWMICKHPNTL